jgi:hypothetical protein
LTGTPHWTASGTQGTHMGDPDGGTQGKSRMRRQRTGVGISGMRVPGARDGKKWGGEMKTR